MKGSRLVGGSQQSSPVSLTCPTRQPLLLPLRLYTIAAFCLSRHSCSPDTQERNDARDAGILLPRSYAASIPRPALVSSRAMLGASASAYALLRGKRGFMVEDDDRLYCALKDTLNDAGCETFGLFTAASENLYAVPSSQFDVALVDVSRRDARFARVIQSLNERGVPMLLITGRSRTDLPAQLQ